MLDVAAAQFHWEVPSGGMVESNENNGAKTNTTINSFSII